MSRSGAGGAVFGAIVFVVGSALAWEYGRMDATKRRRMFPDIDCWSVMRRNPWVFVLLAALGLGIGVLSLVQ
jgi:hypothetical protein